MLITNTATPTAVQRVDQAVSVPGPENLGTNRPA